MPQTFVWIDSDWYFAQGGDIGLPIQAQPQNPPFGVVMRNEMRPAIDAWSLPGPFPFMGIRGVAAFQAAGHLPALLLTNGTSFLLLTDGASHLLL